MIWMKRGRAIVWKGGVVCVLDNSNIKHYRSGSRMVYILYYQKVVKKE